MKGQMLERRVDICWNLGPISPSNSTRTLNNDISYIQDQLFTFLPTSPIKLKLRLQKGKRLIIATHLDQSNCLVNWQQQQVLRFALLCLLPTSTSRYCPCDCWYLKFLKCLNQYRPLIIDSTWAALALMCQIPYILPWPFQHMSIQ
jgi:hypothetical protein